MWQTIFRNNTEGARLMQRHHSWVQSQPTLDDEAAPLDYLQLKNKESLARWREKVNSLAAAGRYPFTGS